MDGKAIITAIVVCVSYMAINSFEMDGKTIITAIVVCVSYIAINKWIRTPTKRGPNPIRKNDDDDPPSLPPDPAYLPSSPTAEISISEVNQQESVDLDPSTSSAESSFMGAPMLENPEPLSEINQESMNLDPSSSLLSFAPPQTYDVFLSFRGADTRKNIVSHLYRELQTSGIKTFKDDGELEIGDPIGVTLLKAIEDSKCAIVVLSKNYAQSAWCLVELAKICRCMKDNNRILPLFYHVEPSDVRYQKNDFADAFTNKHDNRRSPEEVKEWREALKTVAKISGCVTKDHKDEAQVIKALVKRVRSIVRPIENGFISCSPDFEPFEETRKAMNKVMEALKNEKFTAIGVHGMGGIGKTTMVEHVGVEAQKSGLFREVIMANISKDLKLRKFLYAPRGM